MQYFIKPLSVLGLVLLFNCWSSQPCRAAISVQRPLAFVRVNVIPMTRDGVLRDQTVIVEGDRITRIGPSGSTPLPPNVRKIDGRGKYLMPGLVDMHVHLRARSELLSYLAHGVTTVVHLSGPMGNVPDVVALRGQIMAGEITGPNIYTTGRILDGDPAIFPAVSTVVTTQDQARRVVEEQHRAGVDFIKVYNNLSSELLRAVVEKSHELGLAVIGHVPRRDGRAQALQTALATGQNMIAHGEEIFFTYFYGDTDYRLDRGQEPQVDPSNIPQVVRWLRESEAAVTPNLSFVAMTESQLENLEAVLADPETRFLDAQVIAMWRERNPTRRQNKERFARSERAKFSFLRELVRAMQAGGVLLLLGTDSSSPGLFPGKSAHLELRELVRARLTPYEALSTGTCNAGKFVKKHVRKADLFGTISVGARADLLLLEANPLADIGNISRITGVMVKGRWLQKKTLEQMRKAAAGSSNRAGT